MELSEASQGLNWRTASIPLKGKGLPLRTHPSQGSCVGLSVMGYSKNLNVGETPQKSKVIACACNPSAREAETETGGFLFPTGDLQTHEKFFLKGDGWCLKEWHSWFSFGVHIQHSCAFNLSFTCVPEYAWTCIYTHNLSHYRIMIIGQRLRVISQDQQKRSMGHITSV